MLLLLRAALLWVILSIHVVGGAAVFRRLFPRESPWFGFVVPGLGLVVLLNFIEHLVALPALLWLLPITSYISIWGIFHPKLNWKGLRLPTGIFIISFAFTLTLRALMPDITDIRDGIVDLALASNFCLGEKVPPRLSWDPDLLLSHYYAFGHYGISVLTRLFGIDIGTGYNLSIALISAFDCLLAAAAAWTISRGKIWITLLSPFLMEGASTGATVYLWFTEPELNPNEADDIFSGLDNVNNHSPLLSLIQDTSRHELVPPGAWSWIGSFHSTSAGLFLVLFFVVSLMEVLRRKATNWPWICLGSLPLLTTVTSTWAIPFEGLVFLGAAFWIWYHQYFPKSLRFVMLNWGIVIALMTPVLTAFLTTASVTDYQWTAAHDRIQVVEFLVLWWPIYLPSLALLFTWPKLSPAIKTILICWPISFLAVDFITVANGYDWVGKLWCFIYGAGWITLLPAVCMRQAIPFRLVSLVLIVSSLGSFGAWASYTWRVIPWGQADVLHLEGTGPFRWDPVLSTLLADISRLQRKTILTGKADPGGSPALAAFSGNRIYVAWWSDVSSVKAGVPAPEIAFQRGQEVNDFYEGKCENPLLFLRSHDIFAAVVYPEDKVTTDIVKNLKKNLAPYYEYVDCNGDNFCAGIFFFHPETMKWPKAVLLYPPHPHPPVITSSLVVGGLLGTKFNYAITAEHIPISYGAIGLPTGLTIDPISGVITGNLTAIQSTTVTLTAINAGGTGDAKLIINVHSLDGLPVVDGLTTWLRADTGVQPDDKGSIDRWSDLTANANDAEQPLPKEQPSVLTQAIKGHPAIHFDGANSFLAMPPSVRDDFSIFVVFRSSTAGAVGEQWFDGSGIVDAEVDGVVNDFGLSMNAKGEILTGVGNPDTSIVSTRGGYNDSKPHLVDFLRTKATGFFAQYVDSIFQGTVVGNTGSLTDPARITIGATQSLTHYFGGDVSEVLVYDRVLTPSERQQVESYLMKKYGMFSPTPAVDSSPSGPSSLDSNNHSVDSTSGSNPSSSPDPKKP